MTIIIGEVIAVKGVDITIKVFDESNKDTLFYHGDKYKGISIREYIAIQRGLRQIVCIIQGEYLDEHKFEFDGTKTEYIRKVEAKPIGFFENNDFNEGIKYLPMIKDSVFLLQESKITQIYSPNGSTDFIVGKMLKEDIPISIPWQKLFNSHIAIFGNTGSGKSNTLAKIYTVLFREKLQNIKGKSTFILLDFNGEYTKNQLLSEPDKKVFHLNTREQSEEPFPISENEFWEIGTLSILFQATVNTQRPFLNRVIKGKIRFNGTDNSLQRYLRSAFKKVFTSAAGSPEAFDLLRELSNILDLSEINEILKSIRWNGRSFHYTPDGGNGWFDSNGDNYENIIRPIVDNIDLDQIQIFDELVVRCNLQLIHDLLNGYVQFDFIQPLLKRIDSSLSSLRKVLTVSNEEANLKTLTVISLKKCNQEMKKVLPLLIAKHFYHSHKETVHSPPDKTIHLIIDEAHNILSQQSFSELESWKDYRLELFEEIIKEGRKFGMFLTLASQRPADISPTIVSQIHNFFIHRLVNDRDLQLLDNTISTLDRLSKSMIPNLSKGSCIVTGTSFDLPMSIQIAPLNSESRPDSDDIDLLSLWCEPEQDRN